jgi:PhnB protein
MAHSYPDNVRSAIWLANASGASPTPMSNTVPHVPTGLVPVIPQLVVKDARKLLAFLESAFGAQIRDTMPTHDGKGIMHGHLTIEGVTLFIAEPFGPAPVTTANTFVYVRDVDATVKRAVEAGAKLIAPVADMPWGDRWGMVQDAFGNTWQIATHVEDVPPDEMKRRMAQPPQ